MEHVATLTDVAEDFASDLRGESRQGQETEPPNAALASLAITSKAGDDEGPPHPAVGGASRCYESTRQISELLARSKSIEEQFHTLQGQYLAAGEPDSPEKHQRVESIVRKMEMCADELEQAEEELNVSLKNRPDLSREDRTLQLSIIHRHLDYLRETRGLMLHSLCIHLIPVKPSVLSRAIDLSSLRKLTLLNVGTQAPIWSLLSKENSVQPLALRSVYTDNVSDAFLKCMSQLAELHELFMLERNIKKLPQSFAPPTTNSIDQIRRLVLAKHMPTLKRLMIKDDTITSSLWDVTEKTMVYICTRGRQLEELAVSVNIHSVVSSSS